MTTVKSRHATTIWKKLRWISLCLPILKSIAEIMKKFKSLYGFGGRCLKIRDVCMDFEPYFKVHYLISVHPKSIILGQMINLDMIFHVVVSVCRLVAENLKLAPVPCWISEWPIAGCWLNLSTIRLLCRCSTSTSATSWGISKASLVSREKECPLYSPIILCTWFLRANDKARWSLRGKSLRVSAVM